MFWFYVLPLGFLLTQYTITGFDASAHISEETHGAADGRAQGRVALGVLLGADRLDRAAGDHVRRRGRGRGQRGRRRLDRDLQSALPPALAELVILISTHRPAVLRHGLRDERVADDYAFSRDRAMPGWRIWTRLERQARAGRAPCWSCAFCALVITLPALKSNAAGIPVAFFAVVSIAVIGLYIAYVIPIYLRCGPGTTSSRAPGQRAQVQLDVPGRGDLGRRSCVIIFSPPVHPAAVPWNDEFDWNAVNYSPMTVGGLFVIVGLWWVLGADKRLPVPSGRSSSTRRPGVVERRAGRVDARLRASADRPLHRARVRALGRVGCARGAAAVQLCRGGAARRRPRADAAARPCRGGRPRPRARPARRAAPGRRRRRGPRHVRRRAPPGDR